jgi:hypothetical protein
MPYAKATCKIPLCKTCAGAYKSTSKYVGVVVVGNARECIGHLVDLDTISGIKRIKEA